MGHFWLVKWYHLRWNLVYVHSYNIFLWTYVTRLWSKQVLSIYLEMPLLHSRRFSVLHHGMYIIKACSLFPVVGVVCNSISPLITHLHLILRLGMLHLHSSIHLHVLSSIKQRDNFTVDCFFKVIQWGRKLGCYVCCITVLVKCMWCKATSQ